MKVNRGVNRIAFLNISSVIVLQGIAFLSTPIFSRMLGTTQYGQYSVFNSWVTIITCFMGFGMGAAIGTGMYHFKEDYLKFRTSVLAFSILVCVIESVITIVIASFFKSFLNVNVVLVVFALVLSTSHYIVNFAQNSYIYEKKAFHNFILSVSTALVTTFLSIYLVWTFPEESKYIGRVYGMMIPYTTIATILTILFLKQRKISFKKEYLQFGFQVGFPIIFHSLSQTLLAQSDRVMMQVMDISNSEIGIYSLFYTLSSVLTVILNALNNTWCPFYYDNLSNGEYDQINKKARNYIELFSILAFGFLMLSPEVSMIMGDESYYGGIRILPILVSAVFFTFMYQFPVNYEFYHKKTKIIATGTIGAAIINIVLNYLYIPRYGMYGAAIATSISYLALFALHFIIVQKLKDVKKYHTSLIFFLPGIVLFLIGTFLFYYLIDFWLARWIAGIVIGLFEFMRIIKRKSIF